MVCISILIGDRAKTRPGTYSTGTRIIGIDSRGRQNGSSRQDDERKSLDHCEYKLFVPLQDRKKRKGKQRKRVN